MREAELFAGFSIRTGANGRPVAVFHLAMPELEPDGGPYGGPSRRLEFERAFDEESLVERIRNLRRQGRDASMSELALRSLWRDVPPNAEAPQIPEGNDPIKKTAGYVSLLATLERVLAEAAETRAAGAPVRGPCLARLSVCGLAARHGIAVEEAVMLGVADRLAENLRRVDTLAQVGADEFAMCLPRVVLADAQALVCRLRRAVEAEPIATPAGPMGVALRIGVIEAPAPGEAPLGTEAQASALFAAAGQLLLAAPEASCIPA